MFIIFTLQLKYKATTFGGFSICFVPVCIAPSPCPCLVRSNPEDNDDSDGDKGETATDGNEDAQNGGHGDAVSA